MTTNQKYAIKREDLSDCRVALHVEINKEEVVNAAKSVQKQLLKYIRIPGFRKDKTPLPLVKRYVGYDRFNEYVERELLPKSYYEALNVENVSPISEVTYDKKGFSDNGKYQFSASFAVAPQFTLGDYKTLNLTPENPNPVDAQEVEKFLQELAQRRAEQKDVGEDVLTENGHWVSLLVKGKIDEEDSKFLRHYNVGVVLGQNTLYPEFDKHLIGKKKLDRVVFEYSFAQDHENKAIAGKTAEFEVKILGHKTVDVLEVNEDFAKETGFDSLDDLRAEVTKELEKRNKEQARNVFMKKVQDALHEIITCEVPDSLRDELTAAKLEDLKADLKHNRNTTFEDHLTVLGQTEEELKGKMNQDSVRELKLSFALTEIARRENLAVHDFEIAYRIDYTAKMLKKPFEDILEYVEGLGRKVLIRAEIMQEKALSWLVKHYDPAQEAPEHEHIHDERCGCEVEEKEAGSEE